MNPKIKGNIFESTSKIFSGLNANALKYIVPVWISAFATVSCRMIFGAIVFWIIDIVRTSIYKKKNIAIKKASKREIWQLILIGGFTFYIFQILYISSFKYTTPVSITVISGLNPIWTFIAGVLLFKIENFRWHKVFGLILSFAGAILILFAKAPKELASNQLLGNSLALFNSIAYALFLIFNKKYLNILSGLTVIKYIFTGAAIAASIFTITAIYILPPLGITSASNLFTTNMFSNGTHWIPIAALTFILFFPTVLSYLLQQTGLKNLSATLVATYTNLEIIVSTIVAIILGQDMLSWTLIISILLMFGGLYFIAITKKKPV